MELTVLNEDLVAISILDRFESLIWVERYSAYGDFEIFTPITAETVAALQPDYYLLNKETDRVMIVEAVQIVSDAENGNRLMVTGRSLESTLLRRIVWDQTVLSGDLQDALELILDENVISPTDTDRTMSLVTFAASTDTAITDLELDTQSTGDYVYDVIQKVCEANGIGFKMILTDEGNFEFSLYAGADRSYDQLTNPYVIFSPQFENIINSNYYLDIKGFKTVTLVAGAGEGPARKTVTVASAYGAGTDLARREMFTDARDIPEDGPIDAPISEADYLLQLAQRGSEYLSDNDISESFEGQVDATHMFKYGEDFFLGDIVQIANEYGQEGRARVVELIRSQSQAGYDIYPTFQIVN